MAEPVPGGAHSATSGHETETGSSGIGGSAGTGAAPPQAVVTPSNDTSAPLTPAAPPAATVTPVAPAVTPPPQTAAKPGPGGAFFRTDVQ